MDRLLLRTSLWIAMLAFGGWSLHWVFGANAGWAAFSGGVVLLLLHHTKHVELIANWLRSPVADKVPSGSGVWDYIFSLLYRYERVQTREHQQLARTLVRFRQAGRAHPDGVVILDADNRIEWCNDTAGSHFDFNVETDIGQPITNLMRQPEFVAYVEAGDYTKPIELRSASGSGAVFSVQIVTYGDAQKLLLSRDITRFERVEIMRRDFVANVSHELRTPLTVVSGFLETILELNLDLKRSRDYVNLMAEQCKRMEGIVNDLLTLSTLESAPHPSLVDCVRVEAMLGRLRTEAEVLSGGRHRIVLDADTGVDLLGSENEIASAFGNLVTNAIRYTPEGGEVLISWHRIADEAEFAVQDSGIGIAPEHIPRLTERFYRVDRGRSRESGGTGLGLAIVKHVLTRHQSTLQITSEPGKGSRFAARFPGRRIAAQAASEGAKPRPATEAEIASGR